MVSFLGEEGAFLQVGHPWEAFPLVEVASSCPEVAPSFQGACLEEDL